MLWLHKFNESFNIYFSAEERTTGKPRRCSAQKSLRIILKAEDYDAERHCFISGMALTDNGTVLLTDWINSNIKSALIKSVSQDSEALSVLPLPSNPRAITVPYTTTAVVAAFNEKLYIISITDDTYLSLREEFKLDFQIEAMVAYNGNLAVTCDTHPRTTKLITLDGRVLWSVSKDTTGQDLFACPCGITITSITDTTAVVVVSDLSKNTLTLLEAQTGKFIRSIDVGEGKGPYGITTDSDGNVYVCYKKTYEICFWSADFQESKILLSGDPRVRRPCCIVYSAVDDSLYVSFGETHGWNEIDSFRLV